MDASTQVGTTLATVISAVGEVFTGMIGWAGTVSTTIIENPLLLFGVLLGFAGVGVTLFKRLLNV